MIEVLEIARKGGQELRKNLVTMFTEGVGEPKDLIEVAIRLADEESGLEDITTRIEDFVLEPHLTPFLNPLALLFASGFSSHDKAELNLDDASIVMSSDKRKCLLMTSQWCRQRLQEFLERVERSDTEALRSILGGEYWHPVRPLRWREPSRAEELPALYGAHGYREVVVDYTSVAASLLAGLYRLRAATRSLGSSLDTVRSLLGVLRRSLLLVPSSIRKGSSRLALPEISLYAHSRVVAGFASAIAATRRSPGCYRLVLLDINGIQRYIIRHRVVSAAVKAFRGRSLLVELAQRAAANFVLSRLGLTWSSVYTYEGGTVSIIAPCAEKLGEVLAELEERFSEEFGGYLGVTAVASRELEVGPGTYSSRYRFRPEDGNSFAHVLAETQRMLSARKLRRQIHRLEQLGPEELEYDPLVEENTPRREYVGVSNKLDAKYWRLVSSDDAAAAIVEHGGVSRDTHRALVAGSSAPNLFMIIELYLSGGGCEKAATRLAESIAKALLGSKERRYDIISIHRGRKLRIGIIELPRLCAVYILLALHTLSPERRIDWSLVETIMGMLAEKPLASKELEVDEALIVFSSVNIVEEFLPSEKTVRNLDNHIRSWLGETKYRIGFDWVAVNTRYPLVQREGRVQIRSLDEAAEATGLIALVKLDADNVGNTVFYMASSPSRLATLSEILTITFGLLSYRLLDLSSDYNDKVYVVFIGGDDAAYFGELVAAMQYATDITRLASSMLPGLTISGAISVEDPKLPIYLAYYHALEHLEEAKNEPIIVLGDNRPKGIVAITQMTKPITLCLRESSKKKPIEIETISWQTLENTLREHRSISDETLWKKTAKLVVLVADTLAEIMKKQRCSLTSVEAARTLIAYTYWRERIGQAPGQEENNVDTILEKITGTRPRYPPSQPNNTKERYRLYTILQLARNPLNTVYQLLRLRRQTT